MAHLERIAIVGASGRVGGAFLKELIRTGKHTVTALSRAGSKAEFPSGVQVARVDYDDESSLEAALRGQQMLIISLSVTAAPDTHGKIVRAAGKAGVPYIMPNAYGTDIANEALADPESGNLTTAPSLQHCREINAAGAAYICVVCGFWLEWSLALGEPFFGFDIAARTVTFFDDGKTKINVSTWEQCGRAVAALLSLPETGAAPALADWKNKPFYFDSFCVSQRDMLDSLNRVLGTADADWAITHEPTDKRYKEGRAAMMQGDRAGFGKALYSRTFYPNGDGQHGARHTLANEALGLPKEDFDAAVKRAVEMVESGWNPFAA